MNKKAYLVLEDGSCFEGYSFGAETDTVGELIFTTEVCGFNETLTDERYSGQIVMQTFPTVGNYGIIDDCFVGKCAIKGYVVREWCEKPSNFRASRTVDTFLKENGVPGIYGVDTRAITKFIREKGVMNAKICAQKPDDLTEIKQYKIIDAIKTVANDSSMFFKAENEKFNVTVIDYGAKGNIVDALLKRGCSVKTVPFNTLAEDILNSGTNGVILSSGPSNPADNIAQIEQIKKIVGKLPILAVGLGHQLLALALGAKTQKLKYGHRGANQPVKEISGNRTYITSQNHGFAVVNDSVTKGKISFINANDKTCEGIDYEDLKAFSVQFFPQGKRSPQSTAFLYDRFVELLGGEL